jgi:hypothetical protein
MSYPAAPWPLSGSLWLSLFRLAHDVDDRHPAGLYGAAFVSYREPSPLTYSELLVARLVSSEAGRSVEITDIWVDSPDSRAGGRELWAIPKELADFELDAVRRGPLETTEWTARAGRTPIAAATFHDASRAALRTPYRAAIRQPGIPDTGGDPRDSGMRGSARTLPARARWDVNPDGPLGWLTEARQLGSARLLDFRMSFG